MTHSKTLQIIDRSVVLMISFVSFFMYHSNHTMFPVVHILDLYFFGRLEQRDRRWLLPPLSVGWRLSGSADLLVCRDSGLVLLVGIPFFLLSPGHYININTNMRQKYNSQIISYVVIFDK